MTTVNKYRFRCETEDIWYERWLEQAPTVCPTLNEAHIIDTDSIIILESINQNKIQIQEEKVMTNENFQTTTLRIVAPPNSTGTNKISWPYATSALSVSFTITDEHFHDVLHMCVGRNTIVGAITQDVSPTGIQGWGPSGYNEGDVVTFTSPLHGPRVYTATTTTNEMPITSLGQTNIGKWRHGYRLYVSPTVVENLQNGYEVNLYNGIQNEDLGRVVHVNKELYYVYVEQAPTLVFLASSPTYVRQTVYPIRNFELGEPWNQVIGESKIGASYIPPDVFVEVDYENMSPTGTKEITGRVELLY